MDSTLSPTPGGLSQVVPVKGLLALTRTSSPYQTIVVANERKAYFQMLPSDKWAIEGFIEAVAQEVAPFNIEFTIVEPGAAKTNFGGGLIRAAAMAVYDNTPAGELRRGVAATAFRVPGDPGKMVQAMIDSVERRPAPPRLALGSDTYALVRAALVERIAVLDAQKDIAFSTDLNE